MSDIVSQELPTVLFPFHGGMACTCVGVCIHEHMHKDIPEMDSKSHLNCSSTLFQDVGFGFEPWAPLCVSLNSQLTWILCFCLLQLKLQVTAHVHQ